MKNFIYGFHAIEEYLKKGQPNGKLLISGKNSRTLQLADFARRKKLTVLSVKEEELDQWCEKKKHKGVILLPSFTGTKERPEAKDDFKELISAIKSENSLILLLDEITDPHNYGAILRSADQLYVDLVISTERRAAKETDTVGTASAGANVHVKKAVVTNLMLVVDFLKTEGYWVYGADMDGKDIHTVDFKGKVALIMGSEGKGIRRLLRENCDQLVRIPAKGHVDSFNVSVAAGILCYEIRRQQNFA